MEMSSGAMPLSPDGPKKPKPEPRASFTDLTDKPTFKLGETVTLTVTGKVKDMGINDYVEGSPYHCELSDVKISYGKKDETA